MAPEPQYLAQESAIMVLKNTAAISYNRNNKYMTYCQPITTWTAIYSDEHNNAARVLL